MKTIYVMDRQLYRDVYPEPVHSKICRLANGEPKLYSSEEVVSDPAILRGVEVVFGSWGTPRFDEKLLKEADKLKLMLFAAGSIKSVVSEEFWNRGIRISSGAIANAIPVAEFALGEILLGLKRFFYQSKRYMQDKVFMQYIVPGGYRSHVGLVSYGMIAKQLAKLLKAFDINVHVWAPELDGESAAKEGLIYTPLKEMFTVCDVVSLHTPLLPSTVGMIGYDEIIGMKNNATLVNTSRGAIIDEEGLVRALRERPDLTALLDVTAQEPLPEDSALFSLPNVTLTPHIAGACNAERGRLGELMAEEFARYLRGEKLEHEVLRHMLGGMA